MASTTIGARAYYFDFNLKYLFLVGLWPNEKWPWLWKMYYKAYQVSLLCMACFYLIITGIGTYMYKDNLLRFFENVDKIIVAYNYVFKIIIFLIKRRQISNLIDKILHSGDVIDEKHEKLMKYHVVVVSSLISVILGSFQLLAMPYRQVIVDVWLPFDYTKSQWNIILACLITSLLFGTPFIYRAIAIQGIVCSIVMYICDQLVDLQQRLKALNYTVANDDSVRREFKDIIKKHIRLMGYAQSLKSVFKEYFLIQNLAITAELCLNALMVSVGGVEHTKLITFMAFLMVALLNAYIFCYAGQDLMDQSIGIAHAAYESTWTSWPVDMQKDLLIVITAAQRCFSLSAGGMANMSMPTFAQALYNGYSIFAVLRDVVH